MSNLQQINLLRMIRIGCLCSLLPAVIFARSSAVDAALVGTWQLVVPNENGPRWLWDIHADGAYLLHAEASTSIPLHSGTMKAKKGKYSLNSTSIDFADIGTYDVSAPNVLKSSGKLGVAWWKRPQPDAASAPAGPLKASSIAYPAEMRATAPSLPFQAALNAGLATHSFMLVLFHGAGPHTDHLISVLRESILNDPTIADQLIFADANVSNKEAAGAARMFQIRQWPTLFLLTARPTTGVPRFAIFGERYGDLDAKTVHDVVISSMCASYRHPKGSLEAPPKGEVLKAACATGVLPPDVTTPILDPVALQIPPPTPPARNPGATGRPH